MAPILLALAFVAQTSLTSQAQDWPGFRGGNGSAVSDGQRVPTSFGPQQHLGWAAEVPFGRSSPILTDSAVVVTGSDAEKLYVLALDRESGAPRWRRAFERAREEAVYSANDSASPTPVTDGENVYVFFPELGLVSLDAQGEERWVHPLGPFVNFYGMSSSPVLGRDTVVLLCDQQQGSYLLALDAKTGEERWKVERSGMIESWTTPVLYPAEAPEQVIVSGSFFLHGYSLKTGKELWALKGFGYAPTPSPTLHGDTLFLCSSDHSEQPMPTFAALLADLDANADGLLTKGELSADFGEHFGWLDADKDDAIDAEEYEAARAGMASRDFGMVAIDLAGEGGPVERWRYKKGLPSISSPLVYRGVVYMAKDSGLVTTLDAESGQVLQRERLPDAMGECYPSPIAVDGKVYITNNAGRVAVLAAGAEWKVLASNQLGEDCFATPAIGDNAIFVRTAKALYRFSDTGL